MSEPWADIVAALRRRRGVRNDGFQAAAGAIEELAALIAQGHFRCDLSGWLAMHDLCMQQTNVAPYSGPFLRVSPLASGMVEFRYVDTAITARQWRRIVPPAAAPARLRAFLDQLRWTAGEPRGR